MANQKITDAGQYDRSHCISSQNKPWYNVLSSSNDTTWLNKITKCHHRRSNQPLRSITLKTNSRSDVSEEELILDSVWSIKQKWNIMKGQVYKWKARLNIHGGQQQYRVNYTETYAPVVTWFAVWLLLILVVINKWHTRQIDFVLAYPQAPIKQDFYMELPLSALCSPRSTNAFFTMGTSSSICYVHDSIFTGPDETEINEAVKDVANAG